VTALSLASLLRGEVQGEQATTTRVIDWSKAMNMTRHAQARSRQRAIPPLIIDWLCKYGSRLQGMNGTTICFFDRESRRSLASEVGQVIVRRLSDMMDTYVVLSGDTIVTVGHRYKRLGHK